MGETLTHWKKNNDPRYISGEDLKDGEKIGKGLKAEMIVEIVSFSDVETFDKSIGDKAQKTGFFLKEVDGKNLYKPVILNKTNALFCAKEFKSEFMEHWIGKPMVLYAKPDTRFGHVARFKKYYPKVAVDVESAKTRLNEAKTLADLQDIWLNKMNDAEKTHPGIESVKNQLKKALK